jgi:hypothetical protein
MNTLRNSAVHLSLESSGPQWRFQITGRELSAADEDSPLLFFSATGSPLHLQKTYSPSFCSTVAVARQGIM